MARDYLQIVKLIEGAYPKSIGDRGGANQDETLRRQLVGYANELLRELERLQRWRLGWKTATTITTPGLAVYPLPSDFTHAKRMWFVRASGSVQDLTLMDENELRLVWGQGSNPTPGTPRFWAFQPASDVNPMGTFQVWPAPDNQGPTAGNYSLQLDYYAELSQIAETQGTITSGTNTFTFTTAGTGDYLSAAGVITASSNTLTIRGGGFPTSIGGLADDLITPWSALSSNNVTTGIAAGATAGAGSQAFFNSSNWIIRAFPKVMLFGMLREVTSYLYADQSYQKWEARYQHELDLLTEWDAQADHGVEVLAGALAGQLQPMLRDIDLPMLYEIRGQ